MGNSSRRASASSERNSQQWAPQDWTEHRVQQLINEKKLAPKQSHENNKRDEECPICFMNFQILNTANCCKQAICTGCYVDLKKASVDCSCPFCGHKSLNVCVVETTAVKSQLGDEEKYCNTSDEQNAMEGSPNLRNESMDKYSPDISKIRSISLETPMTTLSSKSEREAIEQQIKNQRLQYIEEDYQHSYSSPIRYNRMDRQQLRSQSYSGNSRSSIFSRDRYRREHRAAREIRIGIDNHIGASDQGPDETDSDRLLRHFRNSMQTLFEDNHGNAFDRMSTLEQLEELMFMEAIRISVTETNMVNSSTNVENPSATAELSNANEREDAPNNVETEEDSAIPNNDENRDVEIDEDNTLLQRAFLLSLDGNRQLNDNNESIIPVQSRNRSPLKEDRNNSQLDKSSPK